MTLLLAFGCGGARPETLGPREGGLAPCPGTPNCVDTSRPGPRSAPPFMLARPLPEVWTALPEVLESMPRTRVVRQDERYLHAEATSLLFRFVDDVEIYAAAGGGELYVRSASRVGRGDLGVNGRRVERLRALLTERGFLRAP